MTDVPALRFIKKSKFTVIFTFKPPTVKRSFRVDLNQRQQLDQIQQNRTDQKIRINWEEWTRTWSTHECQLKMLLALLAESQRVAYQVGCAGKGRIRLIRNLARRVEEDMMKEVKETCLPLLLEIAACGLFRLPATTIQHRTANSGSSADVLRFQGKSADAIGEPLLCN